METVKRSVIEGGWRRTIDRWKHSENTLMIP